MLGYPLLLGDFEHTVPPFKLMQRPTYDQRTSRGLDLDEFHALVLKPLEPFIGERVHLIGPRPWSLLMRHRLVVLFRDQVSALGDDEATVVRAVRQEVDEALEATETWPVGVLVLLEMVSRVCR